MHNYEQAPNRAVESLARRKLRELEASGLYVFHGTSADVERLERRQAVDCVTGPDGKPGIYASQIAEYAIFMAIAPPLGRARASCAIYEGSPTMKYGLEKAVMARLSDHASGWVYVCNKKDFMQCRSVEWLSTRPVKPIFAVRVTRRDLPKTIQVV
jgi:hypothetical protein